MSPNAGGRGGVAGYTGAQTNFGDLTPYLTYGFVGFALIFLN